MIFFEVPNTVDYKSAREGEETPTPIPLTPKTQGLLLRAKSKRKVKCNCNSQVATESKNKDPNNLPVPKKQSWAQITALEIPEDIMNEPCNAVYVKKLISKNNIRPYHIPDPRENRKPKIAANMEKIASTIGIKNVNWNEVRNNQVGHVKKSDARRETLAKANV